MLCSKPLTKREQEVVELLLQGKSNKEIASALNIVERTVEFHLKNVYAKYQVDSRTEFILKVGKCQSSASAEQLGESTGTASIEKLGKSTVDEIDESADNDGSLDLPQGSSTMHPKFGPQKTGDFLRKYRLSIFAGILLLVILFFIISNQKPWEHQRECENSNEYTVGQTISRSNASESQVHGQFGTISEPPWSAQPGFVTYRTIYIPQIDQLYLKLRYSKNSPASTPVLIYIDNEPEPRAAIYLENMQDWDLFVWTEPILLGHVATGVHAIKLSTDGQEFGVADLDTFILTADAP